MTTHNTGNPVPSAAVKDLYDNAENLDKGINGDDPTWTDRKGRVRKSMAGVELDFQQFLADGSTIEFPTWAAASAAAGAGQIPLNRQVAVIGDTGTHTDPVSGLTVSNSGRFVMVAAGLEWRGADVISQKADRSELVEMVDETRDPLVEMLTLDTGGASLLPANIINEKNELSAGIDPATGRWVARYNPADSGLAGVVDYRMGQTWANDVLIYEGDGPIIPRIVNEKNELVEGIDIRTGATVSVSGAWGGAYTPTAPAPLADSVRPTLADWNHVIVYGQSLAVGSQSVPPITTTAQFNHLTFAAGPRSTKAGSIGANPGTNTTAGLFENTLTGDGGSNRGETPCSTIGQSVTQYAAEVDGIGPDQLVLFCSAPGHGEYKLNQLDMASEWSQVLRDHVTEAMARAVAAGKTYAVSCVVWMQGESDNSTPYQTYYDGLRALQQQFASWVRTTTGQAFDPVFITYQTPNTGFLNNQVARAQIDLATNEPGFLMGGPIYQFPSADGTHLTNVGECRAGWQFGRAVKEYLLGKTKASFIRSVSAVRQGNVIRWRFSVPQGPLAIDVTGLPPTQDFGFCVRDGAGAALPIASVQIEAGDTVVITLAAGAASAAEVRYAMDYLGSGTAWNNEFTGNLRDSTAGYFTVSGVAYPRYHVAPHCRATIINLGG